ncbi:glycerophosphodiester phosphodiesterase family protein [Virgibacillus sp. 7505]|uniref:glycerophosphodiester phosphodiesterase n=1 Tax=Virgibacillus sp. 7505 TaxID=2022548 RepID=UPI001595B083|nr:glycerophosphodiester phosphodiesterase family protein [Virgibacillus sp. 7505]
MMNQINPSYESVTTRSLDSQYMQIGILPVIAHRGASGFAPENTIAAFDLAVEMQADFIELDVQMSKDGQLVVIHDTSINRTAVDAPEEAVYVKDLTFAALQSYDVGAGYDSVYEGQRIPLLEDVIRKYKGKTKFLIELKSPELYDGIEEAAAELLEKNDLANVLYEEVILQSFNFGSIAYLSQLLPHVPLGVLTSRSADLTNRKLDKISTYANYVNTHFTNVTQDDTLVGRIHTRGMRIMPWTVRAPGEVQPLIRAGVDGIITDYPNYVK